MNKKLLFLIAVLGLQTAWMLGTVITQERALASGKLVLLRTVPVDPRDLLRGDYVILSYAISSIPREKFSSPLPETLPPGAPIFVLLEPTGEFHELVQASTQRLTAQNENQVVLRGTASGGDTQVVRVQYGLERYYVPEGRGNPQGKLTVQAAVPVSGRATIKQVLVDGKPYLDAVKDTR